MSLFKTLNLKAKLNINTYYKDINIRQTILSIYKLIYYKHIYIFFYLELGILFVFNSGAIFTLTPFFTLLALCYCLFFLLLTGQYK